MSEVCQQFCRTVDKGYPYGKQQEACEQSHKFADAVPQILAYDVREAHPVIPHGEHAGEIVMRRAHEDAADNNPQISHRTVSSSHNGSENRS